jgi:toxin ParE1/3/4
LTRQAREDVLEIWEHIAADNVGAADRMAKLFKKTLETLVRSPRVGATLSHLRAGLRAFPVRKYVVFFLPTDGGIDVYRVMHGARDWQTIITQPDWPEAPTDDNGDDG